MKYNGNLSGLKPVTDEKLEYVLDWVIAYRQMQRKLGMQYLRLHENGAAHNLSAYKNVRSLNTKIDKKLLEK